jgi:hypothetical protein
MMLCRVVVDFGFTADCCWCAGPVSITAHYMASPGQPSVCYGSSAGMFVSCEILHYNKYQPGEKGENHREVTIIWLESKLILGEKKDFGVFFFLLISARGRNATEITSGQW